LNSLRLVGSASKHQSGVEGVVVGNVVRVDSSVKHIEAVAEVRA